MMTIKSLFVIFCVTYFATTGLSQYHCCQNDLCPIDCVRCDGKPTCYDLSDELGCSNETDNKLLSYEKPPIFVPTILAVLKAQLRRQKVELGYRFPDRNCFESVTSSPATTTETPAWLQLLIELKESLGKTPSTTSTTTTTETPIWKMLLEKLRAEQRGEVYTFTPPTRTLVQEHKITTHVYKPSPTPSWRRTATPPITQTSTMKDSNITTIPYQTTSTVLTDQTTILNNAKYNTNGTEEITTETLLNTSSGNKEQQTGQTENMITTEVSKEKATESTVQITTDLQTKLTTTEMNDQTIKVTTEPATSETISTSASEVNNQTQEDMATDKVFTGTLDTVTPGTIKQTVFFTTPQQEVVTELNQQENVTPLAPQIITSNNSDTTTSRVNNDHLFEVSHLKTESDVINETSLPFIMNGNNTSFEKESDNKDVNMNSVVETEITKENAHTNDLTVTEMSTQISKTTMTVAPNMQLETNLTTQLNINQSHEHLNNNISSQNISEVVSFTTDHPLFLATLEFGVTMSTEYAKTVTESETPAPLQKKVISTAKDQESKLQNTNSNEMKFENDNILPNLEKVQGINYNKENDHAQTYTKTADFVNVVSKTDNGDEKNIHASEASLKSDISEVNKLVDNLLSNYSNSNVSLLSGNLTSSDFIYPSLETKMKEKENVNFNYIVEETKISLPEKADSGYLVNKEINAFDIEFNNIANSKGKQRVYKAPVHKNDDIAVSVVEKQNGVIGTLKDRVATSAVQMNPENEVRVILGKLNALVRQALDSSNSKSKPALNEFTKSKIGTSLVQGGTKTKIASFDMQTTTNTRIFDTQPETRSEIFATLPTTRTYVKQYPRILQTENVKPQRIQSQVLQSKHLLNQKVREPSIQPLLNISRFVNPENTTPTSVIKPPVIPPPVKKTEVEQPANVLNVEGDNSFVSPWWQQTTLSPFSLDNFFGYTTQPPFFENTWFNPTTSAFSWDTMFGAGGIPVTHIPTVPPYNPNQDILNNIYDPLAPDMQIQDIAFNQPIENFGEGRFTTARIVESTPQIRPTREVRPTVQIDPKKGPSSKKDALSNIKTTTKPTISYSTPTTAKLIVGFDKTQGTTQIPFNPIWNLSTEKPYNTETAKYSTKSVISSLSSSTPKPFILNTEKPASKITSTNESSLKIFNLFDTPGNFSIRIQSDKVTVPLLIQPTTQSYPVSNAFDTTTRGPAFPTKTLKPPKISAENRQDVKVVYDQAQPNPVTPLIQNQDTFTPRSPVTSIIQTFWNTEENIQQSTIPSVTVGAPTTVGSHQNQPATNFYWNQGSSRVLSTDIISNWWEQVQPTAPPSTPVRQATPTPTALANLDQCYQIQDNTGFCQSRPSGHYRNPSDCRQFYVCIWDILHTCACPSNTMFDNKIKVCNWDHLVTCK